VSRRPVQNESGNGTGKRRYAATTATAPHPEEAPRDPRALSPLDWAAVLLIALALVLAPLGAGLFSTPAYPAQYVPEGPFEWLQVMVLPLLLALTAAAFGVVAWREGKRPVAIGAVRGLAGALILLACWAGLSLARSPALYLSVNALAVLLAALLMAGLVARLCRDRNGFAALLLAVVVAGSVVAGIGANEYLAYWKLGIVHRVFATFANPDFLAGYLLLTLPVTLSAFAATTERTARLALGVGTGLQTLGLMVTGSRAGIGILLVALLVWLALIAASQAAAGRWKRVGLGVAVCIVCILLGSAPLLLRIGGRNTAQGKGSASASSGETAVAQAQDHSTAFRRWTWIGTVKMAAANPLLGTGLGTFDIAYPRYAVTAYTAHAHNGYLQWAGETGIPGILLLLTGLAAATAFGAHVLFLPRLAGTQAESEMPPPERAASGLAAQLALEEPRLLLAGLLAAVLASMLHNLLDSDWYIVATAYTLCAALALLVGLSRDLAPLATQIPRPFAPTMIGVGGLIAAFLLWRAVAVGGGNVQEFAAREALARRDPQAAIEAYQAEASLEPLSPEPHLSLAQIYLYSQRPEQALQQLQIATRLAQTGKTYYRLGQFYLSTGDLDRAIAAFRRARELQPNTQNLRALGDALRQAGQAESAARVYREMERLEAGPYGTVRAMPEIVETDFAYAHAALADLAYDAGRWAEAADEDARAATVLREFWKGRSEERYTLMPPEKRQALLDLYDKVLTQWQEALRKQGPSTAAEAASVAEEQRRFRQERAQEQAAIQNTESGPPQ